MVFVESQACHGSLNKRVLCHMQMHGFVLDVSNVSTLRRQVLCGRIFMYSGVSGKQKTSTFKS
jgi:hypothetical protein